MNDRKAHTKRDFKNLASHVKAAAKNAEDVVRFLNTTKAACGHCGLMKAESWDEVQIAMGLTSAAKKLTDLADRLKQLPRET